MKKTLPLSVGPSTSFLQVFENNIELGLETKSTLAEKLRYSISYINKLMKLKKIPYLKNGKSVRFRLYDVLAALEKESAI